MPENGIRDVTRTRTSKRQLQAHAFALTTRGLKGRVGFDSLVREREGLAQIWGDGELGAQKLNKRLCTSDIRLRWNAKVESSSRWMQVTSTGGYTGDGIDAPLCILFSTMTLAGSERNSGGCFRYLSWLCVCRNESFAMAIKQVCDL